MAGCYCAPSTFPVEPVLIRAATLCLVLLLCGPPARNASAWGEEGHRMVGNIASRYLTPEAARQVAYLLRYDRLADKAPSGRSTLGEIANWADEIKDTPWGKVWETFTH